MEQLLALAFPAELPQASWAGILVGGADGARTETDDECQDEIWNEGWGGIRGGAEPAFLGATPNGRGNAKAAAAASTNPAVAAEAPPSPPG